MMNFKEYAAFYDLIYRNKDYENEVNFIVSLIKKYDTLGANFICDIGCGTGKHAELLNNLGYKVTGVELSPQMIELAADRCTEEVQFINAGIHDFQSAQAYDVCISLFHVISYLTSDVDLELAFKNVSANLRRGGIFLFDFWFYEGVHKLKPETRVHEFEGSGLTVKKFVESDWHPRESLVIVDYNMEINFQNAPSRFVKETHKMRYFKLKEIETLAVNAGLEVLEFIHFYDGGEVNSDCWAVGCLARKI